MRIIGVEKKAIFTDENRLIRLILSYLDQNTNERLITIINHDLSLPWSVSMRPVFTQCEISALYLSCTICSNSAASSLSSSLASSTLSCYKCSSGHVINVHVVGVNFLNILKEYMRIRIV